MTAHDRINLDDVAARIVRVFPELDRIKQHLSLELYCLLAEGQPVSRAVLAQRVRIPIETVDRILDSWPGVFSNAQRQVVGYWGLAIPAAYASPHRFKIDGRTLSAWCAWDTLFLPQLLGRTAEIDSIAPNASDRIHLTVTPDRVERVEPADAQMSFLLPDAAEVHKDVLTAFCHFVHFFPSRQSAESWGAQHPGTFMLSIDNAHALARRKNWIQYPPHHRAHR
jgi:alkylmercury lyase